MNNRAIKNLIALGCIIVLFMAVYYTTSRASTDRQIISVGEVLENADKNSSTYAELHDIDVDTVHHYKMRSKYYYILMSEGLVIGLIFSYMILSSFYLKAFKETFNDLLSIFTFIVLILVSSEISLLPSFIYIRSEIYGDNNGLIKKGDLNSNDFEQLKGDVKDIALGNINKNISIEAGGDYSLSGTFNHSIYINTNDEVNLIFNNITINSPGRPTIINKNKAKLNIDLLDSTDNNLISGNAASSEDVGVIYSDGPLTINGNGSLHISSMQNDAVAINMIEADLKINGGLINIESDNYGIMQNGDNNIYFANSAIYIGANTNAIYSDGTINLESGTLFTENEVEQKNITIYNVKGGRLIATNNKKSSIQFELGRNSVDIQNGILFGFPDQQEIDEGNCITLSNSDLDDGVYSLSFKNNKKIYSLIISDKIIVSNVTYQLFKNKINNEIVINNVYLNTIVNKGSLIRLMGNTNYNISSPGMNYFGVR